MISRIIPESEEVREHRLKVERDRRQGVWTVAVIVGVIGGLVLLEWWLR